MIPLRSLHPHHRADVRETPRLTQKLKIDAEMLDVDIRTIDLPGGLPDRLCGMHGEKLEGQYLLQVALFFKDSLRRAGGDKFRLLISCLKRSMSEILTRLLFFLSLPIVEARRPW